MDADRDVAAVAALLADPARARMLTALMDGRARTVKELAYQAGVTPQTASSHLARLLRSGLVAVERQSRHRYFRLAGPGIGQAVEALMAVAPARPPERAATGLAGLRLARTCYDHLAGRLGVAVTEALVRRGVLIPRGPEFALSPAGARFLGRLGLDVEGARRERRALARPCLDWSERRMHLAGALGADLARCFATRRWVRRVGDQRTLAVTAEGVRGLRAWLGLRWRPGV